MNKKAVAGLTAALASAVMLVLISGCAWSIGEGKGNRIHQPTKGQELVDLKKAKEQGAISEDEYNQQRTQVLNR
jgi:hypothetical protein